MQDTKKSKRKPRKIIWADITHLSLCKDPKTGVQGIYKAKAESGAPELHMQASTPDEKGQIWLVGYPANLMDEDLEWADPAGCEALAHSWARNGFKLDEEHSFEELAEDEAYPLESFIIGPNDTRFDGMPGPNGEALTGAQLEGSWAAKVQLVSEEKREQYRSGKWTGASMGSKGKYLVEEGVEPPIAKASVKDMAGRVSRMFRKALREQRGVTSLSMNVRIPQPGDFDFESGPTFHIDISGKLEND